MLHSIQNLSRKVIGWSQFSKNIGELNKHKHSHHVKVTCIGLLKFGCLEYNIYADCKLRLHVCLLKSGPFCKLEYLMVRGAAMAEYYRMPGVKRALYGFFHFGTLCCLLHSETLVGGSRFDCGYLTVKEILFIALDMWNLKLLCDECSVRDLVWISLYSIFDDEDHVRGINMLSNAQN